VAAVQQNRQTNTMRYNRHASRQAVTQPCDIHQLRSTTDRIDRNFIVSAIRSWSPLVARLCHITWTACVIQLGPLVSYNLDRLYHTTWTACIIQPLVSYNRLYHTTWTACIIQLGPLVSYNLDRLYHTTWIACIIQPGPLVSYNLDRLYHTTWTACIIQPLVSYNRLYHTTACIIQPLVSYNRLYHTTWTACIIQLGPLVSYNLDRLYHTTWTACIIQSDATHAASRRKTIH